MIYNKQDFINKIHLIISLIVVISVSFVYGFYPDLLVKVDLNTIDELNIFKGIMVMYLAFSAFWILGLFQTKYLRLALVSNMIFMLGLGAGRLLSLCIDGMPTLMLGFGTFGELVLGLYGLWVLNRNLDKV